MEKEQRKKKAYLVIFVFFILDLFYSIYSTKYFIVLNTYKKK